MIFRIDPLTGRRLPRRSERIPIIQERARLRQEYMMERFNRAKHLYRQYRPYPSEIAMIVDEQQLADTTSCSTQSFESTESVNVFRFSGHSFQSEATNESLHSNTSELHEESFINDNFKELEDDTSTSMNESDSITLHELPRIHSVIEMAPNEFKILYEGKVSSSEDCLAFIQQSYRACYGVAEAMVDD